MSEFIYLFRIGEAEQQDAMGTPERAQQSMQAWMGWMRELEAKGHLKNRGQPLERAGRLLADRFEVEALIGQGGMGSVYSGVDCSSGLRVAIKVIEGVSSKQADALARFLREARAAATRPRTWRPSNSTNRTRRAI